MVDQLRSAATPSDQRPLWVSRFPATGMGSRAQQLADQFRRAIGAGALRPGDRVLPSRRLAGLLGLSRGTVVTALEQLAAEGLVEAVMGSGTFIAAAAAVAAAPASPDRPPTWQKPRSLPEPPAVDAPRPGAIDFRPCRPAVADFPVAAWRRCLSWAAGQWPTPDYGDPRGDATLRTALASYLRRARSMTVDADDLMVTNGSVHAMHLLASVYLAGTEARTRAPAAEPVAVMEDPGYPLARQLFAGTGARIHDCPVDRDGLRTDRLPAADCDTRLIYVTAANQFPTGARLSLSRRQALVAWARRAGALIVEDDYDGEFRYDVDPLPPLATVGAGQVAYCGSFSKTLFPDLRLGFVAGQAAQIEMLASYRTRTDYTGNQLIQRALGRFIDEAHYERHLHRMRRRYSAKRRIVVDYLAGLALPIRLLGTESGLNVTVAFDAPVHGLTAVAFARRAQARGVLVPTLQSYQSLDQSLDGLVLGYAALDAATITEGLQKLFAS